MSNKDLAVGAVGISSGPDGAIYAGNLNINSSVSKKPCYLITFESTDNKNKKVNYFIAVDKPELLSGFVQVKGFYSSISEKEIVAKFISIVASTSKEEYVEMIFPSQKISSIRSLSFNAVKPIMVNK